MFFLVWGGSSGSVQKTGFLLHNEVQTWPKPDFGQQKEQVCPKSVLELNAELSGTHFLTLLFGRPPGAGVCT